MWETRIRTMMNLTGDQKKEIRRKQEGSKIISIIGEKSINQ